MSGWTGHDIPHSNCPKRQKKTHESFPMADITESKEKKHTNLVPWLTSLKLSLQLRFSVQPAQCHPIHSPPKKNCSSWFRMAGWHLSPANVFLLLGGSFYVARRYINPPFTSHSASWFLTTETRPGMILQVERVLCLRFLLTLLVQGFLMSVSNVGFWEALITGKMRVTLERVPSRSLFPEKNPQKCPIQLKT